jgi:hypothetical protein
VGKMNKYDCSVCKLPVNTVYIFNRWICGQCAEDLITKAEQHAAPLIERPEDPREDMDNWITKADMAIRWGVTRHVVAMWENREGESFPKASLIKRIGKRNYPYYHINDVIRYEHRKGLRRETLQR